MGGSPMSIYAAYGAHSGDLLTYQGRPLVHDSRAEFEFLLPGTRIVEVTARDLETRSPLTPLPIGEHPDFQGLTWPLTRDQFR
jgi:hypothetical protein